jgi:large subunit ribosomal protein L17
MANSLLLHKRINTTVAKAKALRTFVEPLITRAKNDSTHNRRMVFRALKSKTAVTELFREVIVKVGERPGGYTRILKTGNRLGDNAEMCLIELVDYNENLLTAKEEAPKKRRSRRGKKTTGENVQKATTETTEEVVEESSATETEAPAAEEKPAEEPKQEKKKDDKAE